MMTVFLKQRHFSPSEMTPEEFRAMCRTLLQNENLREKAPIDATRATTYALVEWFNGVSPGGDTKATIRGIKFPSKKALAAMTEK